MMNNPMLSRVQESQVSHDPPHDMKCAIVSSGQSSIDITMYSVPASSLAEISGIAKHLLLKSLNYKATELCGEV